MCQFQPIENSSLIIFLLLFEDILVEVYEVLVNVLLKSHSNLSCININLSDNVWVVILIQFEVTSQNFTFYLQVANMVNVALHSH